MTDHRYVAPPSLGDLVWMAALVVLWATAPLVIRIAQRWHARRAY